MSEQENQKERIKAGSFISPPVRNNQVSNNNTKALFFKSLSVPPIKTAYQILKEQEEKQLSLDEILVLKNKRIREEELSECPVCGQKDHTDARCEFRAWPSEDSEDLQ